MEQLRKKLMKSADVHSLAGNLILAMFSLALFLLMVRSLDKATYGGWVIFITAASLLDMLRFGLSGTGAIRTLPLSTGMDRSRIIAASYHTGILACLGISVLCVAGHQILSGVNTGAYYLPVLKYYPLLACANLATLQAGVVNQGLVNFKRLLVVRALTGTLNLMIVGFYVHRFSATIQGIIAAYIVSTAAVSLFIFLMKWDGRQHFRYFHRPSIRRILDFGKYSMASYLGSNLLRSSDAIILGLSPAMGAESVAVYAIPLKFVEIIEIPMRSFTATAYPRLSLAIHHGKTRFNQVFGRYLGYTVLFLIPVAGGIAIFSGFLLPLVGGTEYADSIDLQRSILNIILIYILLLPFDRYTGMALFAIDQPRYNFLKIIMMLTTNIIMDLLAVFVFQSLELVALATVVFTLIGTGFGWYCIQKFTGLSFSELPSVFYRQNKYILNQIREVLWIRGKYPSD